VAVTKQALVKAAKRAVRAYLAVWARLVLRVRKPAIVGVTGTVGKTTTKEVLAAVLSHPDARPVVGLVYKSPFNLNDNLGLPLAVLRYPDWQQSTAQLLWWLCLAPFRALKLAFFVRYADVLVLEYALSPDSDFSRLVRLAPPHVAIVTAVGPAHLDTFGTVSRIAQEKGLLVRAVPPSGLVVLGSENPFLSEMAAMTNARVITVTGAGRELSNNIAHIVGPLYGIPKETIESALRDRPAVTRRLKFHELGPVTLIDDTINANPLSMRLALATLSERAAPTQRKVAVLGFMAELGQGSAAYHREIGAFARTRADVVVAVGPPAADYAGDHWFDSAHACGEGLRRILQPGDLVLVKGSASAKMDVVTSALKRLAQNWPDVAA
jgi:UDP-N-acetylmuramoyl-tripeptide--D-alanyl-D-alanine ligase